MQNQNDPIEQNDPNIDVQKYLDVIKELKENSVPKEKYESLQNENRELLKSVIDGVRKEDPKELAPDIATLKKNLQDEMSNLEYASSVIALRKAIIENGDPDPFMPQGHAYVYDEQDAVAAQRVADALEYCIEIADGDASVFNRELDRIMIDTNPFVRIKK